MLNASQNLRIRTTSVEETAWLLASARRKPGRVGLDERVGFSIKEGVEATLDANEVAFDISPGARVVVPEVVVVRCLLTIVVLSREPQVVVKSSEAGRVFVRLIVAEGIG